MEKRDEDATTDEEDFMALSPYRFFASHPTCGMAGHKSCLLVMGADWEGGRPAVLVPLYIQIGRLSQIIPLTHDVELVDEAEFGLAGHLAFICHMGYKS